MLALFGTMLVGCTQSEYIGDAPQQNGKIVFSGASGKMTRATSNTAASVADKLAGQIKFYGVKKKDATYADVFQNYVLWSQGGATTSNPDGDWEYVGVNMPYGTGYGTDTQGTTGTQTIKYWDHSTDEYHFVAGSPVKAFTYALDGGEIKTATVTGIAGTYSGVSVPVPFNTTDYAVLISIPFPFSINFVSIVSIISAYSLYE